MSRTGPLIPLTEFKKLLKEDEFIDYFNKFLCLPAFSQLVVYSRERKRFILYPPLPGNRYVLNCNGLTEWLWRKRFNLFVRSRFYAEYRLCRVLISHSLLKKSVQSLTMPGERAVYDALNWLQKKSLGRVSAVRKFRKFLHKTEEGYTLFQYWLDAERLYFHIKRRSSAWMDVFTDIKERYFERNNDLSIPQHMLDLTWERLPKSHSIPGVARNAKTYNITFTICLQKLCAERLKRYWMPRFLMRQKLHVAGEREAALQMLAQKYLHGAITLPSDYSNPAASGDELGLHSEPEDDIESHSDEDEEPQSEEHDEGSGVDENAPTILDDAASTERQSELQLAASQKKTGGKGVSFLDHPPPGVATSSDEEADVAIEDDQRVRVSSDLSSDSSEDEEEYKKRMEKRKAQARERRSRRITSESRKRSDVDKPGTDKERESDNGSSASQGEGPLGSKEEEERQKRTKESSGGSDSAESWEGVHDQFRKKKGEKKFRFKDRHRKRSIHKRRMAFEELLVKESYRRPSMNPDKVKMFAKGKMNIEQQKILLDDEEDREMLKDSLADVNRHSPAYKTPPKSPGGTVMDLGGKALLKAALRLPSGNLVGFGAAQSGMSVHDSNDVEKPDLFNRSPSLWDDLSLNEITQRLEHRASSDLSSLGHRTSLLSKIGKLRRPSGPHRTPSLDSTGSATTVHSGVRRRRVVAKPKAKKTKVTTLTFSLSGDAPAPAEKSAKTEAAKSLTKGAKEKQSRYDRKESRKSKPKIKPASLTSVSTVVSSRVFTLEKDNTYRIHFENKRIIVSLQAENCASQPFRGFLVATDNGEMVHYLSFWEEVEKTRQDFEFGSMTYTSFTQSIQSIVGQYLLPSSPCRIEAPEFLRQEAILTCLSPELQEMPWQLRKLQMEVMEDLKYAHEAFTQQDVQSFLNAAAFKKDDMRHFSPDQTRRNVLPPLFRSSEFDGNPSRNLTSEMDCRMKRSLRIVMELNLPYGRQVSYSEDEDLGDESDDDGRMRTPSPPKYVRDPPIDYKELASRSSKQYPDPKNPLGLGSRSSLKMSYDRRMHSAGFYKPLKRGGQFLKRPMVRPKGFTEVLKDTTHFEFFKRFLKAYHAEVPLNFWNAVEVLRTTDKVKLRQSRARSILKRYFHNLKIPATKMLQCNSDIIKEIPFLDVVTTSTLFTAQSVISRLLEERWFRRYSETFEEAIACSDVDLNEKSFNTRSLISRNRRLKRIWVIFSEFIKRAASFLRAMRQRHMFTLFSNFLEREMEVDDVSLGNSDHMSADFLGNRSGSTFLPFMLSRANEEDDGVKQRIINGQLVTFNFLPSDLTFYRDIECYKTMADCLSATESLGANYEKEMCRLKQKAELIVSCYLDSDITPRIRVNVPAEVADITIESLQNDLLDRGLFHEATVYVFPLLLTFWKRFCLEHYKYVPTLSKKHKMIYGLKMTPAIAEKLRNERKGIQPEPEPEKKKEKKKKKTKRVPTEDLPDYLDIDMSKVSRKRGSPFAGIPGEEMGPRITFSIRKGITLIEPVRRRKYQVMKGGSPDIRVVHELTPPPRTPSRAERSVVDIPFAKRPSRRVDMLDASLLQKFADISMLSSE